MVKLEWGLKRTCLGCTAHFYDLQKTPPTCPMCGTAVELSSVSQRRSKRGAIEKTLDLDIEDIALVEGLEIDVPLADEDDALIEDDEDLSGGLERIDDFEGIHSDSDH